MWIKTVRTFNLFIYIFSFIDTVTCVTIQFMENILRSRLIKIVTVFLLLSMVLSGCSLVKRKSDIPSVDESPVASGNIASKNAATDTKNSQTAKTATSTAPTPSPEDKGFMEGFVDSPAHEWIILRHAAGKVKIGDTKEDIYGKYPKESLEYVQAGKEDNDTAIIKIMSGGEPAIVAEFDTEKTSMIWRIRVKDFRYKTSEGIHVGSTVDALREAYDDLDVRVNNGNAFIIVGSTMMSFVLDSDGLSKKWMADPKEEKLSGAVKIREIMVL